MCCPANVLRNEIQIYIGISLRYEGRATRRVHRTIWIPQYLPTCYCSRNLVLNRAFNAYYSDDVYLERCRDMVVLRTKPIVLQHNRQRVWREVRLVRGVQGI